MKISNKIIVLPLLFLTGCNLTLEKFNTNFYNKNPEYKNYIDQTIRLQFVESLTLIQIIDSMENSIISGKIDIKEATSFIQNKSKSFLTLKTFKNLYANFPIQNEFDYNFLIEKFTEISLNKNEIEEDLQLTHQILNYLKEIEPEITAKNITIKDAMMKFIKEYEETHTPFPQLHIN